MTIWARVFISEAAAALAALLVIILCSRGCVPDVMAQSFTVDVDYQLQRQYKGPLLKHEVFTNGLEMAAYIAGGAASRAYAGQIVVLVEGGVAEAYALEPEGSGLAAKALGGVVEGETEDWSLRPAVTNVDMGGHSVTGAADVVTAGGASLADTAALAAGAYPASNPDGFITAGDVPPGLELGETGETAYRGDWGAVVSNLAAGAVQPNHTGDVAIAGDVAVDSLYADGTISATGGMSVGGNVQMGTAFGTNTIAGDTQIGNSERLLEINQKGLAIIDAVSEEVEFAVEQYGAGLWRVDLRGNPITNAGAVSAASVALGGVSRTNWPAWLEGSTNILVASNAQELFQQYGKAAARGANAQNRITIMLTPGVYTLASNLVASASYVDILSITGQRDVFVTGGNIEFAADHIRVRGLDVSGATVPYLHIAFDKPNQLFENVKGGTWPMYHWAEKKFSGTIRDSDIGVGFCRHRSEMAGRVERSRLGNLFLYYESTLTGVVRDCEILGSQLYTIGETGLLERSNLGDGFYLPSNKGTIQDCEIGANFNDVGGGNTLIFSGRISRCRIGVGFLKNFGPDYQYSEGVIEYTVFAQTTPPRTGPTYRHCTYGNNISIGGHVVPMEGDYALGSGSRQWNALYLKGGAPNQYLRYGAGGLVVWADGGGPEVMDVGALRFPAGDGLFGNGTNLFYVTAAGVTNKITANP